MKRIIAALLLAAGAVLCLASCELRPPDGTILVKNPPSHTSKADSTTDISPSEDYTSGSDVPETPGETTADTTTAGGVVDTTDATQETSSPQVTSAPQNTTGPTVTIEPPETTAPETTTVATTYIPEVPDSDYTHRY